MEECATGAVYCQVIEALYPGSINMAKVNWTAKNSYEYIANYKLLQQAFVKNGITKHIEVLSLPFSDWITCLGWQDDQG